MQDNFYDVEVQANGGMALKQPEEIGGQTFAFLKGLQQALGAFGGSMLREPSKSSDGKNFFSYGGTTIDNKRIGKMKQIAGKKATLVVNVASKWGLTDSNYKDLVQTYNQFKGDGLEIIAYPSNQFGGQEPGTAKEIKEFQAKYDVNFKVMSKIDVNGGKADAAWQYLRNNSDLEGGDIPWNFSKFLVNKDGDVVAFYPPTRSPSSMKGDI